MTSSTTTAKDTEYVPVELDFKDLKLTLEASGAGIELTAYHREGENGDRGERIGGGLMPWEAWYSVRRCLVQHRPRKSKPRDAGAGD